MDSRDGSVIPGPDKERRKHRLIEVTPAMRTPFRMSRRPSGFSLIEVIFAIAMLGIGIVGVLSLFTAGLSSASKSQNAATSSMEVQSLLTRILSESDGDGKNPTPVRLVLDHINPRPKSGVATGNKPGNNPNPWIHFKTDDKGVITFVDNEKPCQIDPKRDLFWKCVCRPVRSDRDANGSIVAWYPPLNPEDPFDTSYVDNSKARDSAGSPAYVNGLYEIAIAIYRTQTDEVKDGQKPIQTFTTFVTAGF